MFAYIGAALLVGGVALNEYLQTRSAQTVEESAIAFETAVGELSDQNFEAAANDLEALANSDARIAPMASNYLAQARLTGNGDRAAAISALEAAANDKTPIGKLSLIKAAYLKSPDTSRADLEAYLGNLLNETSQFGALSLELVAAKAAEEGDYEFARKTFNDLRFLANVPPGVVQRATAALDTLPPASAAAEPVPAETPSETDTPATDESAAPAAEATEAGAVDGDQPE